jgi:hypothetical protein
MDSTALLIVEKEEFFYKEPCGNIFILLQMENDFKNFSDILGHNN